MRNLLQSIESSPGVRDFIERARRLEHMRVLGASGSAKSLGGFLVFKHLDKSVLYLAKGLQEADQVYDDVLNYAKKRTTIFPSWETLPHEGLHPHPEIVADRFRTLEKLAANESGKLFIVASVQSLMQKVVPPKLFLESIIGLSVADEIDRDEFLG